MVRTPPEVRFWRYVEPRDGCLVWTGHINAKGYGRFWDGDRTPRAHRWAYEFWVGPIPEGMVIDHLCRNPACVYVGHLEVVTVRENTLRGRSLPARYALRTHCKNGHPLVGPDAEVSDGLRWRRCLRCRRKFSRNYRISMDQGRRSA